MCGWQKKCSAQHTGHEPARVQDLSVNNPDAGQKDGISYGNYATGCIKATADSWDDPPQFDWWNGVLLSHVHIQFPISNSHITIW